MQKKDKEIASKQAAKDRLKLVLMQDRASVSPDFFEMMKQEIIDVIKKYNLSIRDTVVICENTVIDEHGNELMCRKPNQYYVNFSHDQMFQKFMKVLLQIHIHKLRLLQTAQLSLEYIIIEEKYNK